MNNAPILLNIARQITDFPTLMNFMLVSKKCLQVVKYVILEAPAIFIPLIYYETQAVTKKQYMFDSLQELFTLHHKYYLENPDTYYHYNGRIIHCENRAGPCCECLFDGLSMSDYGHKICHPEWQGCGCNDIEYTGIKMVKYFHTPRPLFTNIFRWKNQLMPSDEGFRMSKTFGDIITPNLIEPDIDPKDVDRKSMKYLYYGCPPAKTILKLGMKEWWLGKWNRFYPATTDNLERHSVFIYNGPGGDGYNPEETYVNFSVINNKWELQPYQNTI